MNEVPACWLAQFSERPCEGRLRRCHLIRQQILRREVWNQREKLRPLVEAMGRPFPGTLRHLLWDERSWVYGCGGMMGNGGHHGELDQSRRIVLVRVQLPGKVEEMAMDFGISWWLDKAYGELR